METNLTQSSLITYTIIPRDDVKCSAFFVTLVGVYNMSSNEVVLISSSIGGRNLFKHALAHLSLSLCL